MNYEEIADRLIEMAKEYGPLANTYLVGPMPLPREQEPGDVVIFDGSDAMLVHFFFPLMPPSGKERLLELRIAQVELTRTPGPDEVPPGEEVQAARFHEVQEAKFEEIAAKVRADFPALNPVQRIIMEKVFFNTDPDRPCGWR